MSTGSWSERIVSDMVSKINVSELRRSNYKDSTDAAYTADEIKTWWICRLSSHWNPRRASTETFRKLFEKVMRPLQGVNVSSIYFGDIL